MSCQYCRGSVKQYRMIIQSGATVVTERCEVCRRAPKGKPFISKAGIENIEALPIWSDETETAPACQYDGCTNKGVEYHHFAPRHLFEDADYWPTGWLCKYHHDLWHKRTQTGTYWRAVKP